MRPSDDADHRPLQTSKGGTSVNNQRQRRLFAVIVLIASTSIACEHSAPAAPTTAVPQALPATPATAIPRAPAAPDANAIRVDTAPMGVTAQHRPAPAFCPAEWGPYPR